MGSLATTAWRVLLYHKYGGLIHVQDSQTLEKHFLSFGYLSCRFTILRHHRPFIFINSTLMINPAIPICRRSYFLIIKPNFLLYFRISDYSWKRGKGISILLLACFSHPTLTANTLFHKWYKIYYCLCNFILDFTEISDFFFLLTCRNLSFSFSEYYSPQGPKSSNFLNNLI